ncbi:amidohydrolase family protein [uncultured Tateyamaria sp.]|uniref:amidohydrolase family protein n=1 Tax=uncultured Tateyamaria sp. TaxID=455651 RepID=UPI00260E5894|nr:amidohydrolase family protein [uncultured Tateyamaria sp.]
MNVLVPRKLIDDPGAFGGAPWDDCLHGAPVIKDGRLIALTPSTGAPQRMVLPRLVEPHCHLDKCHTIHRLGQVGGNLRHAITRQFEDKVHWTEEDLRARASKGLAEAQANGCHLIRSHVDWGTDPAPPLSWRMLCDLAAETPGLQLAALIGANQWADPAFVSAAVPTIAATGGVLGAFVLDHDHIDTALEHIFDAAVQHGLMLDFHVDEGLGDFNGLEAIADRAIATGFEAPILCGHAVSLMDRTEPDFARIADKCARAGMTICALPVTNLYLQGRVEGTPDRRGITRLRELRAAGVPVIVGSDNVADAFCPLGAHDPRAALALGCVTAHLDPPLGDWLSAITTDAAAALGHRPVTVDGAALSDLLTCDVTHTADLVSGHTPLLSAEESLT